MASAVSLFLIAAGAVLYYAVSKTVEGVALDTVGIILMVVGAIGLVVSLFTLAAARGRAGRTTVVQDG
jgi:Co/Zn/Cd efflux system component